MGSRVVEEADFASDLGEIAGWAGAVAKLEAPPANASEGAGEPVVADLTAVNALAARGANRAGLSFGIAVRKKPLRALESSSEFCGAKASSDCSFLSRSPSALACSWRA